MNRLTTLPVRFQCFCLPTKATFAEVISKLSTNTKGSHKTLGRLNNLSSRISQSWHHRTQAEARCITSVVSMDKKLQRTPQPSGAFHTSPRRHINPLLWVFVQPVARLTAIISARQFRKWWKKLDTEEKDYYYQRWGKFILAGLGLLGLFGMGNYFTHLQETPITKRKRYIALTDEQFKKVCQFEVDMMLDDYKGRIVDFKHPVYKRVQGVVKKLIDSNQDLELLRKQVWKIIVVDTPEANACVLPSGHIFVNTGIINLTKNDDQLAVVLGHEIAHAVLGHSVERASYAQFLDKVMIVVLAGIWCIMPNDGIAIITHQFFNFVSKIMFHLPQSRMNESEADQVGLILMSKACYDVREAVYFWKLMDLQEKMENIDIEAYPEVKAILAHTEWLETHPASVTRADEIIKLLPDAIATRKKCKCLELPKRDPRESILLLESIVQKAIEDRRAELEEAEVRPEKRENNPPAPVQLPVIPVVTKGA